MCAPSGATNTTSFLILSDAPCTMLCGFQEPRAFTYACPFRCIPAPCCVLYAHKVTSDHTRVCANRQVLITPHTAFLTNEALENIAAVTLDNIATFFEGRPLGSNEVRAPEKKV